MDDDVVIALLDEEIALYQGRLAKYRRKADARRDRKGERDMHADRLCEWAEHRLVKFIQARDYLWG